jgi:hypothetical protein
MLLSKCHLSGIKLFKSTGMENKNRVLAWKIRIDLGTCDFDTAERRLLRAETLVRIIVQPHLVVQSGEVL